MEISELVSRRTDLSTFVVHLTRTEGQASARDKLKGILTTGRLEARTAYGQARAHVLGNAALEGSQKVVCFTETPLEHIHLHTSELEGRELRFQPYGVALTKRVARRLGVNPIWYVDITPGHTWLTNPLNELIETAIASGSFPTSPIAKLAPYIEQMGSQPGSYRKEFWWEREWRFQGHLTLPTPCIGICPAQEHQQFEAHAEQLGRRVVWIDPTWGLEEIIGRLAGWSVNDLNIM